MENDIFFEYKGKTYPEITRQHFSSQYIFPVAEKMCLGRGIDVGCAKEEWALPGAIPVDIEFDDPYDAYNLPAGKYDYIFSSHCLEHLQEPKKALMVWKDSTKDGGILFLYLPHPEQIYWAFDCPKHVKVYWPQEVADMVEDSGYTVVDVSGRDLNYSFSLVAKNG